jgi:hypothetical protein
MASIVPMKGIVQRVFREHYTAYREQHALAVRERRAAVHLMTCRTPAQGYHVWTCPSGDYQLKQANSCKHRSCPLCGASETERWVQAQEAQALPCAYHQIVFTLPHDLHPLWLYNRALFTNLFFRAAWEALRAFCGDSRWLGAEPGALAVFQSWGETLNTHIHLHVLITAGGLTPAGQWRSSPHGFLFPSRALAVRFRGRMRAELLSALAAERLILPPSSDATDWRQRLNRLGRQRWHVQIQPPYTHPRGLILYLARYLRRGPIAESRIHGYQRGQLTITYKRPDEHRHKTFRLSASEFLRRLLVHVPPKGLRVVRAYGLFHHRRRLQLAQARAQLLPTLAATGSARPLANGCSAADSALRIGVRRCPHCNARLAVTRRSYPCRDGPPQRIAA